MFCYGLSGDHHTLILCVFSFFNSSRNLIATTLWARVSSLSTTLCLPAICLLVCPAAMNRVPVWVWPDIQLWSQRRLPQLDFLPEVISVLRLRLFLFSIRLLSVFLTLSGGKNNNNHVIIMSLIFIWISCYHCVHQHPLHEILVIPVQVWQITDVT